MLDSKKLWAELEKYDIEKLSFNQYSIGNITFESKTKFKTLHYIIFNFNINRLMYIYEYIEETKNEGNNPFKLAMLCENTLVLLIISLEVYFGTSFRILAEKYLVKEVDYEKLKSFTNSFQKYIKINPLSYNALPDIFIIHILPSKLDFQLKDNCRNAFKLFDIILPEINQKTWQKIFSNNNDSYIKLRHRIVHGNTILSGFSDITIIENAIQEVSEFVYQIEQEIMKKHPRIISKPLDLKDKEVVKKIAEEVVNRMELYEKFKND